MAVDTRITSVLAAGVASGPQSGSGRGGSSSAQKARYRLEHRPETRVRNTNKKQATCLEQGQGNMGVYHESKFPGLLLLVFAGGISNKFHVSDLSGIFQREE